MFTLKLASQHGYLNKDISCAIDEIIAAIIDLEKVVIAINIQSVNQVIINP